MKIVAINTDQNSNGWTGEIRLFKFLYFALVVNYLYGVRITLSAGIKSFEAGIVLIKWEINGLISGVNNGK